MHKFRIYYDDGRIIDALNFDETSIFGVILIVQNTVSNKPNIVHGNDFFYLNLDEESMPQWRIIDWSGILDRLLHNKEVKFLLQGRYISNDKFREFYNTALNDPIYLEYLHKWKGN